MSPKPTIVFVPGAWHLPSCFELVETRLKSAGYAYVGVRIPSVRNEPPFPKDISDDIQAVRNALEIAIEDGNDVVLVMHSYGGLTGSAACKGMSKEDRIKEGKRGGVVHLVYVSAVAVKEGETSVGVIETEEGERKPPDWCIVEAGGYMRVERSREMFYNDLPDEEASKLSSQLQYHSTASLNATQSYSAFEFIPSTYVICELDNALPAAVQEMMATQPGANMVVERLKSGHSPFYSMPEETSIIIRKAAGEL